MNGGVLIDLARQVFVRNFFLKFIAVILTLALYIWVSEDRETIVTGFAPVQIVVPDDLVLVSDPIDRIEVTVQGRWSDIDRFAPNEIDPIRLDLSPGDDESVISITPEMVGVPPEIQIVNIEPDSMYVEFEPESFKSVPVEPQITGTPRPSYTIEDQRITPETVTVRGPENRLDQLDSVPTERVDITDRSESLQRAVRLRIDDGLISAEYDDPIMLEIDIETEEITETLEALPVEAVNTSYDTTVEPAEADVVIRGPESVIDTLNRDLIRLEIDLSDEDDQPPGTFSRSAEVINLPPDVESTYIEPDRFRVVTEEASSNSGMGGDEGESL